ncbi:MAG: TolC family protein, partial [Candidatus Marinimicrobia bacterium]|nr:TolC family protein [Candidatus Neomarinimicrobiota bacterium]
MIFLAGAALLWVGAGVAAQAADTAAAEAELRHEMAALVQTAQANHPRALEALAAWEAARQQRAGADGFFDPLLTVAAGRAEWLPALAGVPAPEGLREQSTLTRAAVERPLWPGLYARAGWTERFWDERLEGTDERRESLLGVSLSVPLGRDRGLRQWRLEAEGLDAGIRAGAAGREDAGQYLRYETERRYLAWIEAANAVVLAGEAAARFETLLNEAIERERQGALPAYQVAPARM